MTSLRFPSASTLMLMGAVPSRKSFGLCKAIRLVAEHKTVNDIPVSVHISAQQPLIEVKQMNNNNQSMMLLCVGQRTNGHTNSMNQR